MDTTVVIAYLVKRRDTVFLGPIGFVIGKRLVVEATDQGQAVGVGGEFFQIGPVLRKAAGLVPERRYPRMILPAIETLQILFNVQGPQGNPAAQPRIEATVDLAFGLGWPQRMTAPFAHALQLRINPCPRCYQPGLRHLPERRPLNLQPTAAITIEQTLV